MDRELPFASARSAFRHEGIARRLVAEFKFGGQPVLGGLIAQLAAPAFIEYAECIAPQSQLLVSWVPAHKATRRERGYNQAEILARRLTEELPGATCMELAVKVKRTKHQKGLDRVDRASNLRDAFSARQWSRVDGGASGLPAKGGPPVAIILVDDVYTTGATAAVVSAVVSSATRLPVHVFTFSRAVSGVGEGHD